MLQKIVYGVLVLVLLLAAYVIYHNNQDFLGVDEYYVSYSNNSTSLSEDTLWFLVDYSVTINEVGGPLNGSRLISESGWYEVEHYEYFNVTNITNYTFYPRVDGVRVDDCAYEYENNTQHSTECIIYLREGSVLQYYLEVDI